MDMPGYGYSDKAVKRGDEPLDIFCAKIILGLIDHLGIDKAHLYGSSQFSPCCLRFGIEYPDRVGKGQRRQRLFIRGADHALVQQQAGDQLDLIIPQGVCRSGWRIGRSSWSRGGLRVDSWLDGSRRRFGLRRSL